MICTFTDTLRYGNRCLSLICGIICIHSLISRVAAYFVIVWSLETHIFLALFHKPNFVLEEIFSNLVRSTVHRHNNIIYDRKFNFVIFPTKSREFTFTFAVIPSFQITFQLNVWNKTNRLFYDVLRPSVLCHRCCRCHKICITLTSTSVPLE